MPSEPRSLTNGVPDSRRRQALLHGNRHEEAVFRAAYRQGLSIVLKGPTGCGKTASSRRWPTIWAPLITVACHDTSPGDLVGRYLRAADGLGRWPADPCGARRRICTSDEVVELARTPPSCCIPLADYDVSCDRTTRRDTGRGTGFGLVVLTTPATKAC